MMLAALQSNWIVDPIPQNLPTWAMVLGLEALLLGTVLEVGEQIPVFNSMNDREQFVITMALAIGFLFLALSILRSAYDIYATYLFLLFRTVEGAAVVRFYRKVLYVLQNWSLPGSTSLGDKALHYLVVFSVLAGGLGLAFNVLSNGPVFRSFWYDLALIYTVTSFLLAFLGANWRLQVVENKLNGLIIVGFALCVAGAEIFNYASISGDIAVTFAGAITYMIGFWVAVGLWGLDAFSPTGVSQSDDSCEYCGTLLTEYQQPKFCPDCGAKID
jgi:hypothetical protein